MNIKKYTIDKYPIGHRFPNKYWTVIGNEIEGSNNEASIKVQCDCGYIGIVRLNLLTIPDVNICCRDCISKKVKHKFGNENYNWRGSGTLPGELVGKIKSSAKIRNLAYDLSAQYLAELFELQQGKCNYTGLELTLFGERHKRRRKSGTASLDRIDNNIGYIKGNVHWVHRDVNFMKGSLSENRFIELSKLISKKKVS